LQHAIRVSVVNASVRTAALPSSSSADRCGQSVTSTVRFLLHISAAIGNSSLPASRLGQSSCCAAACAAVPPLSLCSRPCALPGACTGRPSVARASMDHRDVVDGHRWGGARQTVQGWPPCACAHAAHTHPHPLTATPHSVATTPVLKAPSQGHWEHPRNHKA